MFKNYFKIFLRNLYRNKIYSIINIAGLSMGIACSMMILLWIGDELSFDRYHKNANEIYRIVGDDGIVGKIAVTCSPLASYVKDNFPEALKATRYMPYSSTSFKYKNKLLNIDKGVFADPDFFEMFSFRFIRGNPKKVLTDIANIVITESVKQKFFGNEDAIGKALLADGKNPVIVSAVIKDPPANSQLQFNFILNAQLLKYLGLPFDEWSNAGLHTFIQVNRNADIPKLNTQIADLMPKHIPGFNRRLLLQSLTDIHLDTGFAYDLPGLGDKKYVYIFSAIALFLVLIACINYVNLSTAKMLKRSKEVGLRKIMGSKRFQVIKQLFSESLIVVSISFFLAIVLVEILLPIFSLVSGKTINLNYSDVKFLYGIGVLIILVSLISGVYPALYLSSIEPVKALKNILSEGKKGALLRKTLVVVQFSLSIILIVGTTIIYYQLNFIKNKKLGFDKENIIYFKAQGKFLQNYSTMKNELLNQSSILDVTAEDRLFTNFSNSTDNLYWEGKESKNYVQVEYAYVDYNYFNMLNIQIKDGRSFSQKMNLNQSVFILNQEALDQMKLKEPLGKRFVLNNIQGKIVGVIKNTYFKSLHHTIVPVVYLPLNNYSTLHLLPFIWNLEGNF